MYNWEAVGWMFARDGSLRDIYVHHTDLTDWELLVDLLNRNYDLNYGPAAEKQIDKRYVLKYLVDESGQMESRAVRINCKGINIHCYFFQPAQVEFDITPTEITSFSDFKKVEQFMNEVSKTLRREVVLALENSPEQPLFTVDFYAGIRKLCIKS